ncbi:NAD-dependent epimerase/dehydratase family protein [Porphyrobacter sp. YT40]|uniref:NAD-dependent epimerase/dehydratase family protein n=1 Tax=Porphyrobacter sp. YT40 TaxID=2547601 RepID=UPI0011414A9C|nr:NAD-dependent epimerase/dehydratase family protein [Porphyrobacter sp. YT40]QDH34019.1 SDR family NAD(P)-dependent oxidoreductase [Porphyrobacter sp. YT40]
MTARRILITGATGGLGRALVREALARGTSVRATGRDSTAGARLAEAGAEFVRCDLAQPDADLAALLTACDSVIHAAALSASWGRAADFETANVTATRHLLDAARVTGVGRFVFVSSPSIFARMADQTDIGPDDPPAPSPLNAYARTKLAAERMVLAASDGGLATCAIRPRALVGDGDRVILPRLAALARRARMPLPRGGRALIELTDLRDAAWAICEAEARAPAIAGQAINISGGRPSAVRDLALSLAEALGERPQLVNVPLAVARPIAAVAETLARLADTPQEPVLTRYTLATLAYSQTFDLAPARALLGYEPRHDALATLLEQARRLAATGAPA